MSLQRNDVVVITGASRGIGKETAIAFAKNKCVVALLSRDVKKLEEVRNEIESIGSKVLVVPCDVSNESDCTRAIQKVLSTFGKIDVLINNAGYGHYSSLENLDTNSLDKILKTNLFGTFWCTKAAIPIMKKQKRGHIVNVSTIISKRAFPYMGAYCISKFAMTGFDESLRLEVAPYGIRVSLVCPGYTNTEFQQNAAVTGDKPRLQQKGGMKPSEVAKAILNAVVKNKPRTILTLEGKLLLFANKVSPSFVDAVFAKMFAKPKQKEMWDDEPTETQT